MGQELVVIIVGLATYVHQLKGKCVRVWTDSAGGEGGLRKGGARSSDHNLLIHAVWLLAARNQFGVYIRRVGTHDNIADDPSREAYELFNLLDVPYKNPRLPSELWHPQDWADHIGSVSTDD